MKKNIVNIFLVSASILSLIRCLLPLQLTSDPSIQIGAALNLLDGEGLSNYALHFDIAQTPAPVPLTWFPPGFSLLVFLFLKLGFPLAITLKLIYTITTLVGWLGWALIFKEIISLTGRTTVFANFIIVTLGIILPLYFTFDWCGTDIFLWAGIPWVIKLTYWSDRDDNKPKKLIFLRYLWLGNLVGFIYYFRYAGAFLLLSIFLVIWNDKKKFIKFFSCSLGFLIFFIPLLIYKLFVSSYDTRFSLASLLDVKNLISSIISNIPNLKNAEYLFFSHLSNNIPNDFLFVLWLLVLAFFTFRIYQGRKVIKLNEDKKNLFSLLKTILIFNSFLIIFLFLATVFASVKIIYVAETRFYYSLFPSMLFYTYGVFYFPWEGINNQYSKISKYFSIIFILFFCQAIFLFNPYKIWSFYIELDTFKELVSFPSNRILIRKPESYQKLLQLLEKNPGSLAISSAQDFDYYHEINSEIRKRLTSTGLDFGSGNYWSSKELKVYFVFNIQPNCPSYCYIDTDKVAKFIDLLPAHKIAYRNEQEKIQIIATKIPKEFKFQD